MADDYCLDMQEIIANATDRAHEMVGAYNSLRQKIKAGDDSVVNMHCSAHRAALSAADGRDGVVEISEMEAKLLTVWKYYYTSGKHAQNLNESSKILSTKGLLLKARGKTCWLSGQAAGISIKSEIKVV